MADPWKDEQEQQTQELTEIIQRSIDDYGKRLLGEGRQPTLNAVGGALASAIGAMLASVNDRRVRKALRKSIDDALPQAIAAHEGRMGHTRIVTIGRLNG